MDPLSLTASITAVLGAGTIIAQGLRRIQQLKGAPDLLLQLNNEIIDLHVLIRAVDEIFHRHNHTQASFTDAQQSVICNVLVRAKHTLLELEELIAYFLTKETDEGSKIDRLAWLRSQGKVTEVKGNLQRARVDLYAVCTVVHQRFGKRTSR